MQKELQMLERDPPPGVSVWPAISSDGVSSLVHLEATLFGPQDSPYADGAFKLDIVIPSGYPMEPPAIRFVTPVYHPNIDEAGRICLNTLKMPPSGSWKPSLNISTVLLMLRVLLAEPNAADGLVPEIVRACM